MSIAPGFLIAFPHLLDANFRQSVVVLLQQTGEGAMGVVVNRESSILVSQLCADHSIDYSGEKGKKVRTGGPLHPEEGLVLFSSEHADPEGEEVVEGLHVSASSTTLSRLCGLKTGRFQCFAGYAGWGPGQLEHEIREGTWVVSPLDPALVLDTPTEEIWTRSLRAAGIDPSALVPGAGDEA